jgi:hypothetical protein
MIRVIDLGAMQSRSLDTPRFIIRMTMTLRSSACRGLPLDIGTDCLRRRSGFG